MIQIAFWRSATRYDAPLCTPATPLSLSLTAGAIDCRCDLLMTRALGSEKRRGAERVAPGHAMNQLKGFYVG